MTVKRFVNAMTTFIGFALSQGAFAIGVGGIAVDSYVNEPLDARIEILDPEGLSEAEVIASLAALEDFERLNIERHYSLGALVFKTDFDGPPVPSIRVTTEEPIREPYLNFLVELKWPQGRVLREYTLFLDLKPTPSVAPVSARNRQGTGAFGFDEQLASNTYRVAPNDTLSDIASRFRIDGATVDQMMLAIKEANPGKFMRDNINGIYAGTLLSIPSDLDEMASAQEAAQKVREQALAWRRPASAKGLRIVADNELGLLDDDASGTQEDLSSSPPAPAQTTNAVGTDSTSAVPDMYSDSSDADLSAIEARLAALSQQLIAVQNAVERKDAEIATLKAELSSRPVANEPRPITDPAVVSGGQSKAVPDTKSDSLLSGNGVWLGFFILMAVATAVYLRRRRAMVGNDNSEIVTNLAGSPYLDKPSRDLQVVPTRSENDAKRANPDVVDRVAGDSLATPATDPSLSDAVAEADVYIAFGRHESALNTLEAASAVDPSNPTVLLKMVEIYVSLDRIAEAQGLLPALERTGDREALSRAESCLAEVSNSIEVDSSFQSLSVAGEAVAGEAVAGEAVADEAVTDELSLSVEPNEIDISLDLEFQEAANPVMDDSVSEMSASDSESDEDSSATALDLARAYLDMGDKAGAKELLETAISSGDADQAEIARQLLKSIE